MPEPAPAPSVIDALQNDLDGEADLTLTRRPADLERLSRDFHDYSPPLSRRLAGARAQLVARPSSVAAVRRVAAACARHRVPLTARGAGTGNYGQCVPLQGGLVLDFSALTAVRAIDSGTGVVEVEAGCVLATLDRRLRERGRCLRLMPSTWRTATVGGFIAGGAGGIGSLRWGFLRDPGHLLGLEIVTLEPSPRLLQLDAAASEPLNHAYGTNGLITALRLATAPAVRWRQLVVEVADLAAALALMEALSGAALLLEQMAAFEAPLAERLPWPGAGPPVAGARLAILAAPDAASFLEGWLPRRGARLVWRSDDDAGGRQLPLRELCWNHTTLHVRAADPHWTYLQLLLPPEPLSAIARLSESWGPDLLWHLEGVRQRGAARVAALPLLRWRGDRALADFRDQCRQLGAVVFDPHVLTVEDGGLGVVDADQVRAKEAYDPAGLLNPGKLRGWRERPVAATAPDPFSSPG
jgi:FAD/FMN-containing dehydrogenase